MIQTISFFYCKLLSVILDCKIISEHTINANIGPGKKCFLCTLIDSGGGVGGRLDAVYFGGTSLLMKKTLSSSPETSKHSWFTKLHEFMPKIYRSWEWNSLSEKYVKKILQSKFISHWLKNLYKLLQIIANWKMKLGLKLSYIDKEL